MKLEVCQGKFCTVIVARQNAVDDYYDVTVKLAHEVTSTKQSHVLKSHLFHVLSQKSSYEFNLFEEVTCLKRPLFLCPKGDLLIQV